jgi:flagellin-like hook-associated protein FlgL
MRIEVDVSTFLGFKTSHRIKIQFKSVTSENLVLARSRILDADLATERAELARHQLLQKAGAAALCQADLGVRLVLALLQL